MINRSPAKDRMSTYLPGYYQASRLMEVVLTSQGREVERLYDALDQTLEQFFIATATWGLRYWESLLGLPINAADPAESRRAKVIAKLRNRKHNIEKIVASFIFPEGAPFRVEALHSQYVIRVVVPADNVYYEPMVKAVEAAKPAHLEFIPALAVQFDNGPQLALALTLSGSIPATIFTYLELYLDGTFYLDGTYPLAAMVRLPDLPDLTVLLHAQNENSLELQARSRLTMPAGIEKNETLDAYLNMCLESTKEEVYTARHAARHTNNFYVSADWLKIDRPLWYLDGEYALDGSRKLDAGLTIETL